MTTELLVQILIIVSIVAVVYLAMVLSRVYKVVGDAKDVSGIASKRAKEFDDKIEQAENKIESFTEGVKGFIYSLDFIKMLKEKLMKETKKDSDKK